jgi:hypothetical protein
MCASPLAASDLDLPAGIFSGDGGRLRRSVSVARSSAMWTIGHSLWQVQLPGQFVDSKPDLISLLQHSSSISSVEINDNHTRNLLLLLAFQGCLTIDSSKRTLDMHEVRYIVQGATATWYGVYYSHPLWEALRNGRLSISQIFLWVLRTYHLSRSAGPTAARGALHSPVENVRGAFLKSCIEEFSHCDDFYFPEHPRFGLTAYTISDLIPLPSSTAFDQQMLHVAENDWLAHLCVAYFQEYTASFRENAFKLYDILTDRYQLPGLFQGWKDHIGYDLDHSHCDDFFDALDGNQLLERSSLIRSLVEAGKTISYLISALDEIWALSPETAVMSVRPTRHDLLRRVFGGTAESNWTEELTLDQVARDIGNKLVELIDSPTLIPFEYAHPNDMMFRAILLRALGFSESHEEALTLGRMLEACASSSSQDNSSSRSGEPVFNFLWELANTPLQCALVIKSLAAYMAQHGPQPCQSIWQSLTPESEHLKVTTICNKALALNGVSRSFQLIELMRSRESLWRTLDQDLLDEAVPTC